MSKAHKCTSPGAPLTDNFHNLHGTTESFAFTHVFRIRLMSSCMQDRSHVQPIPGSSQSFSSFGLRVLSDKFTRHVCTSRKLGKGEEERGAEYRGKEERGVWKSSSA